MSRYIQFWLNHMPINTHPGITVWKDIYFTSCLGYLYNSAFWMILGFLFLFLLHSLLNYNTTFTKGKGKLWGKIRLLLLLEVEMGISPEEMWWNFPEWLCFLVILLPMPSNCLDYRHLPPHLDAKCAQCFFHVLRVLWLITLFKVS